MFSLRDLNQQRSIKRRFVRSWQKEEKAFPQTCPTVHETQKLRRTKNASLLRQGQRVSRRSTSSRRTGPGSGSTSLKLSSKSSTSPSGKAAQIDILSFLEIRRPIQSEVSITKSPKKKNSFRTVAMQKNLLSFDHFRKKNINSFELRLTQKCLLDFFFRYETLFLRREQQKTFLKYNMFQWSLIQKMMKNIYWC